MEVNKRRKLLIRGLALILALMLGLCGCSSAAKTTSTAEYIQDGQVIGSGYKTTESYLGDFEVRYSDKAQIVCLKQQKLTWNGEGDRYGDLLVQQGQMVKKGDVLATFEVMSVSDADILEKQLAIQEADASLNRAAERYEEAIAKKIESMAKLKSYDYQIASLELEKLRSEYAQQTAEANHQKEMLQEALEELNEKKKDNQLVAPFDGRIQMISRSFQRGNRVDTYETLMVIEDLNSEAIQFMNGSIYGSVPYLSTVTLTDSRTEKTFTGTVVSCKGVTEGADAIVIQPDPDADFDMENFIGFLDAEGCLIKKTSVVLLDSLAIKTEGNDYYVFVLTDQNTIQKVYISIGGESGGVTWVTEGLEAGQKVLME